MIIILPSNKVMQDAAVIEVMLLFEAAALQ